MVNGFLHPSQVLKCSEFDWEFKNAPMPPPPPSKKIPETFDTRIVNPPRCRSGVQN